jgi:antitoxin component YwqK of YwqJK toxin-antitoxin module
MNKSKLYTVLLGVFTFGHGVMAQSQLQPKTIHLNAMMQTGSESGSFYRLQLTPIDDTKYKGIIIDGMENRKVEGLYIERNGRYIEDGHFKYFFPNGQIESEGDFQAGVKVGHWKRFDFMGNQKPDRYYPPSSASARRKSMNIDISTDN